MKPLRIAVGAFFPSTHCQRIAEGVGLEAERLRREQGRLIEVWQFNVYDRFLREHEGLEIDGAVVYANYFEVAFGLPHKEWPAFAALGVPWVNTSHRYVVETGPLVVPDDRAIGRLAGRFFRERGFAHAAYCGFPEDFAYSGERLRGFAEGWGGDPGDLPTAPVFSLYGRLRYPEKEMRALADWLHSLPRGCAIFAVNDEKAASLTRLAAESGLRVPQDLAVLGVDDDPVYTRRSAASLSSIDPGSRTVGAGALRVLIRLIDTGEAPPAKTSVNVARVIERLSTDQTSVADGAIHTLLRRVRAFPGRAWTVADMARIANLPERTLTRRFRLATGTSPTRYILSLRLDEARRLLGEGEDSVEEIAEAVGFRDVKWFYRAFSREVGEPPGRFRARVRNA
ncbi:MAG: substrate-binding domain-containing protein [Opitutales bacterium]|nr:substrate-binding domain-containing protein [Opitutales bacterium]